VFLCDFRSDCMFVLLP